MKVFGDMDAELVSTNPYWVERGEYVGYVSRAEFVHSDEKGDAFVLAITVDDESSEYHGNIVSDFIKIHPDMTKEEFDALDSDSKRQVKMDRARLKRRLCGVEGTDEAGLGVSVSELNEDWDPAVLLNLPVEFEVVNAGENDQYSNLRSCRLREMPF